MAKSSPKLPRVFNKRVGPLTKVQKAFIDQFLADQPHEVTPKQVRQLAGLLHRQPKTIQRCIEQARQTFACSALQCVEVYLEAMKMALADGDNKTAGKLAIWGMENISMEGERIVDKYTSANTAPKVYVGVRLGGMKAPSDATNGELSE